MKIAVVTGASSGMGREFVRQIGFFYRNLDEIWVFGNTVTDGMKGEISFCKNLNIRIRHVTEAEIRAKMGGKTA